MSDDPGAVKRWRIEAGPVFSGPGPGDGTDASFEAEIVNCTEAEAAEKAEALRKKWQAIYPTGQDPEIGTFEVSCSHQEWSGEGVGSLNPRSLQL